MSRAQDRADLRDEARQLRRAAAILRGRPARPGSLALAVCCRVLERLAARIDKEANAL